MKKSQKEELMNVINGLVKEAGELSKEPETALTAEDIFNSQLLGKKAEKEADEIIEEAENKEEEGEDEMKKEAGIVGVNLVGSQPGVSPADPQDPMLGKTQTTTNEVEKGIVAKPAVDSVEAIIQALTPGKGVGMSTTEVSAPQISLTKQSEHEKSAAQIVSTLFEKYASVESKEEAVEAQEAIVKYASVAEEILENNLGENYTADDVVKVAERLIQNDIDAYSEALEKEAELEYISEKVAEKILVAFDNAGQERMQKEAEAQELLQKAANLLDSKVGAGNYTEEDLIKVAEAIAEKEDTRSAADKVIESI